MLGYSREELLGQPCTFLRCDICKRNRAEGRDHWCKLFDKGRESRRSCSIYTRDGVPLHVLKNASLLKADGEIVGSVETVTDISELDRREKTIAELRAMLRPAEGDFQGFVGTSEPMQRTYTLLERAAQSEAPVIILGESGTGKELAARAIHALGSRAHGPYIQLNCAALNESLLESELFGHAKGAFTGAVSERSGRFEAADGGDIFLDEIGDVPMPIQVKLLRVLETGRFERVGEHAPRRADVRIITATNQNLEQLVAQGAFREDFFFRINVIPIHLPPLRDRIEDVPRLADFFIRQLGARTGKDIPSLSPEALSLFVAHGWPGNVRELKSALEYAFVLAESGPIRPEHLPPGLGTPSPRLKQQAPRASVCDEDERAALVRALEETDGNKSAAARLLGVSRLTVLNRMRKYGVEVTRRVASKSSKS
jgi:transcriptional regulator with PAS, ATPase and Fis domain